MKEYMRINPADNTAVALKPLEAGTELAEYGIVLMQDIPAGHKFALEDIPEGGRVIKYGCPIGFASEKIEKGSHVHVHNVRTGLSGELEYTYEPEAAPDNRKAETARNAITERNRDIPQTFMGYRRSSGVGTRNEIWIIPTVGCVNHIAEKLERYATERVRDIAAIDGAAAFTHPYGCSQMGEDQENTALILGRAAAHPNCGGVLILSLGCENNNAEHMAPFLEAVEKDRLELMICQDYADELEEGKRRIDRLIERASADKRTPEPVSCLTAGLKCGGSDGLSGITANPLVGCFSDLLCSLGGTAILTEVPEMFGAEQLLMNRAADRTVFEKTVSLINDFKAYYVRHGQVIYENPSPGNRAGGITTLEDKSLGCVQKSGSSPVRDVLRYGDKTSVSGLNLLEGPGNDMVAATALSAAGAQLILFTTGRGTPLSGMVPTVKISTNTGLARQKKNWIDFDAGRLVSADADSEELSLELYRYIIDVASGRKTAGEEAGYHDLTIFKQGVTL